MTSAIHTSTARAVVLARGLGSRMRAADPAAVLTHAQARVADAGLKAMIPIGERPFLDYVLSALADAGVREAALVVAPDHELVKRHYQWNANAPSRLRVNFVVQPEALGTANAILAAETWTGGDPFLALNADNLYPAGVLRAVGSLPEPGLPAFRRGELVRSGNIRDEQVRAFAIVELDAQGYLTRIVEKPDPQAMDRAGDALVSMNCWRFDGRIFDACRDVPRSSRGEYELPQAVMLAVERGVRFRAVPASGAVLDLSRRGDTAEISRRLAGITPRL